MTTLIAWIGVDSRGPASLYFASDSQYSWGNRESWSFGKKIFASKAYPDILAYCGDVTFPSTILNQLVEHIDIGLLYSQEDNYQKKNQKIFNSIQLSFENYPVSQRNDFHIVHGCREGDRMNSVFHIFKISYKDNDWKNEKLVLPNASKLIDKIGSGKDSMNNWYDKWQRSDSKRTSRSVFSAFCDSIESGDDLCSGGPPQLSGIYRTGNAFSFGIIINGNRYFNGLSVSDSGSLNTIEWRNCLFERCDGNTMERLNHAQRQPRPNNLR
jgi:hypothetical protein